MNEIIFHASRLAEKLQKYNCAVEKILSEENIMTLQAFTNNQTIKDRYIRQFIQHIAMDNLIRESYGQENGTHWRGCAVTCLLNKASTPYSELLKSHSAGETQPIQFPEWLFFLLDSFHEKTSSIEFSQTFQVKLLKSIPIGFSDWETIRLKFLIFVLESCKIHKFEAVQAVIDLLKRELNGDSPSTEEWSVAVSAAQFAAESSAAFTARSVAAFVARSVAASRAALEAAWDCYANHLIELFEDYENR